MRYIMKLINVDELKEWIQNWFEINHYYHPHSKQNNIPIPELYDILKRMPAIESERKTGRWTVDCAFGNDVLSGGQMVICSECGKGSYGKQNYCPNCGCRMEVEHEID